MLKIRKVKQLDIEALSELRIQLYLIPTLNGQREEIIKMYCNPDQDCIVATVRDAVVGFVKIRLRSFVDGCTTSPVAYLEGLYVKQEHRQQGIGRKLVQACKEWAIKKGVLRWIPMLCSAIESLLLSIKNYYLKKLIE